MSSKYMRYSNDIEDWLKDRPRPMVKHCLAKMSLAEHLDLTGIRVLGSGKFSIRYYKDNVERNYRVEFGDENTMPNCSCMDWKSSCYPCKHFFAIFKKYPCWGWESMSALYRNSPFLNLDSDFQTDQEHLKATTETPTIDESCNDDIEDIEITDLPLPTKRKRRLINGETIRSLLNDFRSQSFLIENDDDVLEDTYIGLRNLLQALKETTLKESGLPLLPEKKTKIEAPKKMVRKKEFYDLPMLKKKSMFTKRVGEKKEKIVQASKVNVDGSKKKKGIIIETEVIQDHFNYENLATFTEEEHIDISSDESEVDEHARSGGKLHLHTDLPRKDLLEISDRKMLSDSVINIFQDLMKTQYSANGLQDTVLGQLLHFDIYRNEPFVQILHDGRIHWVAISTYGCNPGEVVLMDSLFNGKVADHIKRQICAILNFTGDQLKINVIPVQQQSNGVDCGVFAIAFANYILINKKNPTNNVFFLESEMRTHLLKNFKSKKMAPFPSSDRSYLPFKRCYS